MSIKKALAHAIEAETKVRHARITLESLAHFEKHDPKTGANQRKGAIAKLKGAEGHAKIAWESL